VQAQEDYIGAAIRSQEGSVNIIREEAIKLRSRQFSFGLRPVFDLMTAFEE